MHSMMRLGSAVADSLGQGTSLTAARDVMRHAAALQDLEYVEPPHFGPAPGGYAPRAPRYEEERWKEIPADIQELFQDLWWRNVQGPTGRRLSVPLPAGGGMAFTGV